MKTMQKLMLLLITLSMVVGMLTVPVAAATTVQEWVELDTKHFEGITSVSTSATGDWQKGSKATLTLDSTVADVQVLKVTGSEVAQMLRSRKPVASYEAGKQYKFSMTVKGVAGQKVRLQVATPPKIQYDSWYQVDDNEPVVQYENQTNGKSLECVFTIADSDWHTYSFMVKVDSVNEGTAVVAENPYIGFPAGEENLEFYLKDYTLYEMQEVTKYNVTVETDAEKGSVTLDGADVAFKTVNEGSDVVLAVDPAKGHEVKSVMVDGTDVTEQLVDGTYTLKAVAKDTNIVVTYEKVEIAMYTVTVNTSANGTVKWDNEEVKESATETVEDDTVVVLTVTPDEGYEAAVTVNGEAVELDGDTLTLTVDEDKAVNVSFNLPKEWVAIYGPYTFDSALEGLTAGGTIASTSVENGALTTVVADSGTLNRLTTNTEFAFTQGKQYKFTVDLKTVAGKTAEISLNTSDPVVSGSSVAWGTQVEDGDITWANKTSNYQGVSIKNIGDSWKTYSWYVTVNSPAATAPAELKYYLKLPLGETIYVDNFSVSEWKTPTYYDVTVSANEFGTVLYNGAEVTDPISVIENGTITLDLDPLNDNYQVDTVTVNGGPVDVVDNKITIEFIGNDQEVNVTFSRQKYWKTVESFDATDIEKWYTELSGDPNETRYPFSEDDFVTDGDKQVLKYESDDANWRFGELSEYTFESGKKYKVSFRAKFDTDAESFDMTMMFGNRMFIDYTKYGLLDNILAVAKVSNNRYGDSDNNNHNNGEFTSVTFTSAPIGEWKTYSFVIEANRVNPAGTYGGKTFEPKTLFFLRANQKGTFYVDGFTFEVEEEVPDEPVVEYVDVTVEVGENGSVLYNGEAAPETITVEKGSNVELTVAPATGYKAIVTIDGVVTPFEDGIIVLEALQANAVVEVSFDEIVKDASISEATVTFDPNYEGGYSKIAYFQAFVPASKNLKEMGANFTIGEDTFQLKAEGYTTDYQFGIRVFGDDFDADTVCAFEGYIEVE